MTDVHPAPARRPFAILPNGKAIERVWFDVERVKTFARDIDGQVFVLNEVSGRYEPA